MANYHQPLHFLVVFFVILAINTSGIYAEMGQVLQTCCNVGSTWGSNHTSCAGPPLPLPGITAEDRSICLTTIYICCIRIHRHLYCERGKQSAMAGHLCSLLPTPGGESHKDCCDGCSLGLKAGGRRQPCVLSPGVAFGSPWDESYSECCALAQSGQTLLPELGRGLCTGDTSCTQLCTEINDTIKCSCFTGYRLAPDQKTCEDLDECELGTHSCSPNIEVCQNDVGGFHCVPKSGFPPSDGDPKQLQCPLGLVWNVDRQNCDDVDECASENICPSNQLCVNTVGSYVCIENYQCPSGFKTHPNTKRCIDIDECAESIDDCNHATELCLNSHGGYQCEPKSNKPKDCPAGLKWSVSESRCEDVNECAERKHTCNEATQSCLNTIGSYQCQTKQSPCPNGFQLKNNNCEDIDECVESPQNCLPNQECLNTAGSFRCYNKVPVPGCGIGYKNINGFCVDIDECTESNPCSAEQTCENTVGSYRCFCQQGFTLDTISKTCIDVNECQLSLHSCSVSHRCDNTLGSFTCVRISGCGTGYTLNANNDQCEDDDECFLNVHDCRPDFVCRNTEGSFRCDRVRCPKGQKLLTDRTCQVVTCDPGLETDDYGNCIDIDECNTENICKKNQRCVNTIGSFRCQDLIDCANGYEMNEFGTQCLDIDECALRTYECNPQQTCRNLPGGYKCECPSGFALNHERQCEDVDECIRYRGQICSITSTCENTQGSYICHCKAGFKKTDNGRNCIDVDECEEIPNICQQTCINVWGSHQCSCQQGYILASDRRTCQDIDECSVRASLCIGICINEPGSYSCSCPEGYRLGPDKRTCQDINECEEQTICKGENEVCLNTRGSFRCNIIHCPQNYVRDREHRNVKTNQDTIMCRKKCRSNDIDCVLNETQTITFQGLSLPTISLLPSPLILTTMRAVASGGVNRNFKTDYRILEGNTDHSFDVLKGKGVGSLRLVKSITGPQDRNVKVLMVIQHGNQHPLTTLSHHIAIIQIYVSQYDI